MEVEFQIPTSLSRATLRVIWLADASALPRPPKTEDATEEKIGTKTTILRHQWQRSWQWSRLKTCPGEAVPPRGNCAASSESWKYQRCWHAFYRPWRNTWLRTRSTLGGALTRKTTHRFIQRPKKPDMWPLIRDLRRFLHAWSNKEILYAYVAENLCISPKGYNLWLFECLKEKCVKTCRLGTSCNWCLCVWANLVIYNCHHCRQFSSHIH